MPNGYQRWRMIWNIPRLLKKGWRYLRDDSVSFWHKTLLLSASIGYILWPLDLIPDIPVIGQLDDIGIVFLLLNWFVNRSEKGFIEAEYRIHDMEDDDEK